MQTLPRLADIAEPDAEAAIMDWLYFVIPAIGSGFHPDNSFADYVTRDSGERLFDDATAEAADDDLSLARGILGDTAFDDACYHVMWDSGLIIGEDR